MIAKYLYKKRSTSYGCGIPPFNITNQKFIFWEACRDHDMEYLKALVGYVTTQVTLEEAERKVTLSNQQFEKDIISALNRASLTDRIKYTLIGWCFVGLVRRYGMFIWRSDVEEYLAFR